MSDPVGTKEAEAGFNMDEVGKLALILGVCDLGADVLFVGLAAFMPWLLGFTRPNPLLDLQTIIDVFVSTFPLTITVAALVLLQKSGNLNVFSGIATVLIPALVASLLHLGLNRMPALQVSAIDTGLGALLNYAGSVVAVYWATYGWLLFLKSCIVGFWLANRLA